MSLSYSCRALRYRLGVSHERLLGKPPNPGELSSATLGLNLPVCSLVNSKVKISLPSPSRGMYLPERLELLCLLHRDGMIPTAVKSAVVALPHTKASFSRQRPSCSLNFSASAGHGWPHLGLSSLTTWL